MSDLTMALKRLLAHDAANLTYDEIEALVWGFEQIAKSREHYDTCDCYVCDVRDAARVAIRPVDA